MCMTREINHQIKELYFEKILNLRLSDPLFISIVSSSDFIPLFNYFLKEGDPQQKAAAVTLLLVGNNKEAIKRLKLEVFKLPKTIQEQLNYSNEFKKRLV